MYHRMARATWIVVTLAVSSSMFILGCTSEPQHREPLDGTTHGFNIHWPPIAPESNTANRNPPLLLGDVSIKESATPGQSRALEIAVTIRRPSTEPDREFWNSQLAFANIPWMDEVRVWDAEMKWQWPNLSYLLRRHGVERIERYGGIDPGKFVDNDFAAVLVRRFDAEGKVESQETLRTPLVTAEWQDSGQSDTDIHTLVHVATSETFLVQVGDNDEHSTGMLKLWLIYADFLGSHPPNSWPKEREWAGGILAYCEIAWDKPPGKSCHGKVRFMTPSTATGFEWEEWSNDPAKPAQSRLSDLPK